jgi:hypothetical protein
MSENTSNDQDTVEEPMVPTEDVHPDHRAHAKTPHRVDDDELAERAQHERDETGAGGPAGV